MKRAHLLKLAVCLILLFGFLQGNAQCTLGFTYSELQKAYHDDPDFAAWKDDVAKDGTKYVQYENKKNDNIVISYFEEGIVTQYKLVGDAKRWANSWGEYFDKNFAIQGNNTWVDYTTQQLWHLRVENGVVVVWTYKKD